MDNIESKDLFDRRLTFPDLGAKARFERLVGIDDAKMGLTKLLAILVNPKGVHEWAKKFHSIDMPLLDFIERRPPLVILEGDVGTGKTELAETVGDTVARQEDINVILLPLSLSTRGSGRVGEMTMLLTAAFDETYKAAQRVKGSGIKSGGAVILLVDEADALTQSRENTQMHHEDRAGVNAFVRGVDRLAEQKLSAAVILCTNRLSAIDPAVRRRAAHVFTFKRPNEEQRDSVIRKSLEAIGFTNEQIKEIVLMTGPASKRKFGYTYSDLTQRLLPTLVLDAYPNHAVTFERAVEICKTIEPTTPFKER